MGEITIILFILHYCFIFFFFLNENVREVARLTEELRIEKEKHVSAVESLEAELSALQFQLSAERMMKNDELQVNH